MLVCQYERMDVEVGALVGLLRGNANRRFALAELNDLLTSLAPTEFAAATAPVDLHGLSPQMQNYMAAMVERAARTKGVPVPVWTRAIPPLDEPYFATSPRRVRSYL